MNIEDIRQKSKDVQRLQTEIIDALDALGAAIATKYPQYFRDFCSGMGTCFLIRATDDEYDYLNHDDPKDWGTRDDEGDLIPYPQEVLDDLQSWKDAIDFSNDAECRYA